MNISRQPLLFLCFGGGAAIINLTVGRLCYDVTATGLPYMVSVAIGALCGLLFNFTCNYYFNFTKRYRRMSQHFWTFLIVSLVGVALTSALSEGLLRICHIFKVAGFTLYGARITANFISHFCAVGLAAFYSYYAHKHLSFNIGIRRQARKVLWKCDEDQ